MAREKNVPDNEHAHHLCGPPKRLLAARLKEIRLEKYGEHGGAEVSRRLKIPSRTWHNYERGVTIPAEIILVFIAMTSVSPQIGCFCG